MKERDYIMATNLAKLRIAHHCIADVLSGKGTGVRLEHQQQLSRELGEVIARLERLLKGEQVEN